jgi:amidase
MSEDLIGLSAVQMVKLLKSRAISTKQAIDAAFSQINLVNLKANAIPTHSIERAYQAAKLITKKNYSILAGLPIVIEDIVDVAGMTTTYGSLIFKQNIPNQSDIVVKNLEKHGAVIIGKSNSSEFAAFAHANNSVFGHTLNPWNAACTSGGSAGGSAVAVANRSVWLAAGSDAFGSLRVPASFCGVVAMRPTPGRVAYGPRILPYNLLGTYGPLARNVADLALMLDAMSGQLADDPFSQAIPVSTFSQQIKWLKRPKKIGFSYHFNAGPIDPEVKAVFEQGLKQLQHANIEIEEIDLNLNSYTAIYQTQRAYLLATMLQNTYLQHAQLMDPLLVADIERGLALSIKDKMHADLLQGECQRLFLSYFQQYDLIVSPTTIVKPFAANLNFIKQLNQTHFNHYLDWVYPTFLIALTACPAISLPCGLSHDRLPIGMQLIAKPHSDGELLQVAAILEEIFGFNAVSSKDLDN